MTAPSSPPSPLRLLQRPSLALWIAARFASGVSVMMLRAVFLWQVHELSHSTFYLGLVGLCQFLPAPLAGLVGGAAADSLDRKRIVMASQAVATVCAGLLATVSHLEVVSLPLLLSLVVIVAIGFAFEAPARQATLPSLVPPEELGASVTVFVTAQSLAFVTGPAVAGFVIYRGSVAAAYAVAAGLFATSILLITRVSLAPRPRDRSKRAVSFEAIKEGIAFVRKKRILVGCMALDMFAVLFGGAAALLPVYADEILHVGAKGYGMLNASLEVGALLMSLFLVLKKPISRLGPALLVAVSLFGVFTIVFGLSRSFPLSLIVYGAAGMVDQISVVVRSTIVQSSTPDALRGRVSSVNMLFIGASNQLGAAESGFLASATHSPTFSVVFGGAMCLLVVLVTSLLVPELRKSDTLAVSPAG